MIAKQNYVNCLGTWSVRGIYGTVKREEVVDVFREGKSNLLDLTEMKLNRNGKESWCEVNGIIACVQDRKS